jgi:spore coat polysaccharide biosynthesis protein SpsF (cytidylyltransferase family)
MELKQMERGDQDHSQNGKTAVITQARMSSTRLPGKVMKSLAGKTVLAHFVERLQRMKTVDFVVVATTTGPEDDGIVKEMETRFPQVRVFRGDRDDVLDRYYQAAKKFGVKTIVRITSDCPLVDPKVSDEVVQRYREAGCDYGCNNFPPRSYPLGLDTEVFSFEALERAWKEAKDPREREHVTPYIRENADKFKTCEVRSPRPLGALRWTVDYPQDYQFVCEIFERLYPAKPDFSMEDVLAVLQKEPGLRKLNEKYAH